MCLDFEDVEYVVVVVVMGMVYMFGCVVVVVVVGYGRVVLVVWSFESLW